MASTKGPLLGRRVPRIKGGLSIKVINFSLIGRGLCRLSWQNYVVDLGSAEKGKSPLLNIG